VALPLPFLSFLSDLLLTLLISYFIFLFSLSGIDLVRLVGDLAPCSDLDALELLYFAFVCSES